jgi:peptidoglycan DL-endopeptidase CwlO
MQRAMILMLLATSCATTLPLGSPWAAQADEFAWGTPVEIPSAPTGNKPIDMPRGARARVLRTAQAMVGRTKVVVNGQRFGDDCTGLVRAAYSGLGFNIMSEGERGENAVTAIWRFASHHGRTYAGGAPIAGDLVFFQETYDRNRDGHTNDGLTHIGVVESVDEMGTVQVIHRVARGVVRYRMNLKFRELKALEDGTQVNDWLRSRGAHRLTAQLFYSFATLLPVESQALTLK